MLILRALWASPWTVFGLAVGLAGLATGGGVQTRGRVIEFWGGLAAWILRRLPGVPGGARALTLGHTVLGRSRVDLDDCRGHELVHVRQYEVWGPLFVPVYLGCSVVLWLRGKDPYLDNPFERRAVADTQPPAADGPS